MSKDYFVTVGGLGFAIKKLQWDKAQHIIWLYSESNVVAGVNLNDFEFKMTSKFTYSNGHTTKYFTVTEKGGRK